MLFSEPKIPQFCIAIASLSVLRRFSALQRAENSSIPPPASVATPQPRVSVLFSEPKIPQSPSPNTPVQAVGVSVLFSEPKIPQFTALSACSRVARVSVLFSEPKIPQFRPRHPSPRRNRAFQCSSASRKFLNSTKPLLIDTLALARFSALQRAENSSITRGLCICAPGDGVSVLFSEPKIPQS